MSIDPAGAVFVASGQVGGYITSVSLGRIDSGTGGTNFVLADIVVSNQV